MRARHAVVHRQQLRRAADAAQLHRALAVLRRPDVFHVAVAGAPVTDWRRYHTAYTERYLGHPDLAPQAYDASSLLAQASRLSRPLLLIHGMTDDNVVVAHTLALSGALTAAEAARGATYVVRSCVVGPTPFDPSFSPD